MSTSGLKQADENVKKREAVGRGRVWDKEPAGKHKDEIQQNFFLRGGNRTNNSRRNLAAEEQSLELRVCDH